MRNATPTRAVEMLLYVLLEGTEAHRPWIEDRGVVQEMNALGYHRALDMGVPDQYSLITLASDEAREATREAAQAVREAADNLLVLLDLYEEARQGDHPEWAKFIALLEAPFPVEIPPNCDTRDPDVIAVMLRDIMFDGSWENNLEWLALEGSEEQERIDGARVRRLAAFEEAYEVNLADLLFSDEAKAEHEQLAKQFKEGEHGSRPLEGLGAAPLNWRDN